MCFAAARVHSHSCIERKLLMCFAQARFQLDPSTGTHTAPTGGDKIARTHSQSTELSDLCKACNQRILESHGLNKRIDSVVVKVKLRASEIVSSAHAYHNYVHLLVEKNWELRQKTVPDCKLLRARRWKDQDQRHCRYEAKSVVALDRTEQTPTTE